jgi:hypothetical protein
MADGRTPQEQWQRIQRAVLWSIAVAVIGFVLAVAIDNTAVSVSLAGGGTLSCGSPSGLSPMNAGSLFGFTPAEQGLAAARAQAFLKCPVKVRRRHVLALTVGGILDLPLICWAIFGLLWGGRSIAEILGREQPSAT